MTPQQADTIIAQNAQIIALLQQGIAPAPQPPACPKPCRRAAAKEHAYRQLTTTFPDIKNFISL